MEKLSQKIISLMQETLQEHNTTMHIVATDDYLHMREYRTIEDMFTPIMYKQKNIQVGVDNTLNADEEFFSKIGFGVYFVKDNVKIMEKDTLKYFQLRYTLVETLAKKVKENFTYDVNKVYSLTLSRNDYVETIYKFGLQAQSEIRFIDLVYMNRAMNYQARMVIDYFFETLQELANVNVEKLFSNDMLNTNLYFRLLKARNDFENIYELSFNQVPFINVDLANVNKLVATDFKDYVFVERNGVYYGAFIIDDLSEKFVQRCLYTNYITTALKNSWNEHFSFGGGAYSRYAKENNLVKFCAFCGRVIQTQETQPTRCSTCENFLNRVDLGDYKNKIRSAVYHVGGYDHTDGITFANNDLEQTNAPLPNTLYLGVEIEVDNVDYYFDDLDEDERDDASYERDRVANLVGQVFVKGDKEKNTLLTIKEDGSLNAGMEIVLQPATLTYHLQGFDYAKGFEVLKRFGYNSHDTETCGLHVHINRNFFGTARSTQLYNGAKMVYLLEKYWNDFVLFSRRTQSTLGRWANKLDLKDDFDKQNDDMKTSANLSTMFIGKYNQSKYVALNVGHTNTFELRIFRGTLNLRTYYATLQFVDNFARLVKHTSLMDLPTIKFDDIINFKKYDELTAYWNMRKSAKGDND
jgi:hypothetical protein